MRRATLFLAVLCLSATMASADYIDPPGWESNASFTHQGWNFPTDPGPLLIVADDYQNPYGVPVLAQLAGSWMDALGNEIGGSPRQGGLLFEGPMTDTPIVDLIIPNFPDPLLHKEFWLQGLFITNAPFVGQEVGINLIVEDDQGNEYDETFDSGQIPLGLAGGMGSVPDLGLAAFVYESVIYSGEGFPQPPWERARFELTIPDGVYVILDQLDIDTRCIPEPSTIAMLLGLGAMGLMAFIRRRK